ncbi:MAG: 50S ribosomal protein L22 [Phycisphaerae bacterium]|nr:50S ribosomal protein L22 [Phycisphaerae bacterium]
MKLRPDQLKSRAEEAGLTVEQLAQAVSRTGLSGDSALSAVRNWLGGRDHPRCKKADIERLADAIGCEVTDIARFVSSVNHHRGSPQKARLVVDMIRGKAAYQADEMLQFCHKRAAVNVRKALLAAMADAQEAGADRDALVVAEASVDGAQHIKRFRPKDRGRAHSILKQTSHITVGLQERPTASRY